jgi:uncharacterized protein YbaR (Trm112 family)
VKSLLEKLITYQERSGKMKFEFIKNSEELQENCPQYYLVCPDCCRAYAAEVEEGIPVLDSYNPHCGCGAPLIIYEHV